MPPNEKAAYEAFADILNEYLGFKTDFDMGGTNVKFTIKNVPIYHKNRTKNGDVKIEIPRGRLDVSYKYATPLESGEFAITTGRESFPHPHVWDNGKPCWGHGDVRTLQTLFAVIVRTITWQNVTEDSKNLGHYTPNRIMTEMGTDRKKEISAHKSKMEKSVRRQSMTPEQFFSQEFPGKLKNRL